MPTHGRSAGFYPTTVSYLSLFYTRYEFARRLGIFYGSYGVAGALGGVIAFVVFSRFPSSDVPRNGVSGPSDGWKPWQVLFFLEGILTFVVALIGFFWLPKSAGTAWFLTAEERDWAEERVRIDRDGLDRHKIPISSLLTHEDSDEAIIPAAEDEQNQHLLSEHILSDDLSSPAAPTLTSDAGLSKRELLSTILFLPLIIPILLLNIASAIPSTAFSIFLPLVLSSLDLSSPLYSNLLTAPPFLLASITLYIFTYWSDKSRKRIIPVLTSLGLIAVGLILTLTLSSASSISPTKAKALYLALCVILSGSFIPSPLTVAWLAGNIPDPGKRAIILGINGWGNLAGVFAALLFSPRWREEAYRVPFAITLGLVLASLAGYAVLGIVIRMINAARARVIAGWSAVAVERERISGSGWAQNRSGMEESMPAFAVVGGPWWDTQMRFWAGRRLLRVDREESLVRLGDERLTFTYGL